MICHWQVLSVRERTFSPESIKTKRSTCIEDLKARGPDYLHLNWWCHNEAAELAHQCCTTRLRAAVQLNSGSADPRISRAMKPLSPSCFDLGLHRLVFALLKPRCSSHNRGRNPFTSKSDQFRIIPAAHCCVNNRAIMVRVDPSDHYEYAININTELWLWSEFPVTQKGRSLSRASIHVVESCVQGTFCDRIRRRGGRP